MEVSNQASFTATQVSANSKNTTHINEQLNVNKTPQADHVSISQVGALTLEIDNIFEQMDNIYTSKLTQEQKKELDGYYHQLDKLFERDLFSQEGEAKLDTLFSKIDDIYSGVEDKLSQKDAESLTRLDEKAENLLQQEDSLYQKLDREIESLESSQENILIGHLTNKQKQSLELYHKQLAELFSATSDNSSTDSHIEDIFSKISNVLNEGFEKLSLKDKEQFEQLENKLTNLYSAVEYESS